MLCLHSERDLRAAATMRGMAMFDIRDVLRSLGVEPEKSTTWPVGWAIRDLYLEQYDRLPDKELRAKTNGNGGHCMAVYPESFWDDATNMARHVMAAMRTEAAKQPDLFNGPKS
jgi:hypothetical protein